MTRWPRVRVPLTWACGVAVVVSAAFAIAYAVVTPRGKPAPRLEDIQRAESIEAFATELDGLLR